MHDHFKKAGNQIKKKGGQIKQCGKKLIKSNLNLKIKKIKLELPPKLS